MSNKVDLPEGFIPVLNKGYVGYIDHMGSDLSVTAAARASFNKTSKEWNSKEERLLNFLVREKHTSPFRQAAMTLEIYAPLIIARQWWKHVVASTHLEDQNGWNESSRRYVTEAIEYYAPDAGEWRSAPENKKQGSGAPVNPALGNTLTEDLVKYQDLGTELYERALADGIAPEQARLFLPAYGLYVRWRWTFSLGAVLHFLQQRLADDAQNEIRAYSEAVRDVVARYFPNSVKSTLEYM